MLHYAVSRNFTPVKSMTEQNAKSKLCLVVDPLGNEDAQKIMFFSFGVGNAENLKTPATPRHTNFKRVFQGSR